MSYIDLFKMLTALFTAGLIILNIFFPLKKYYTFLLAFIATIAMGLYANNYFNASYDLPFYYLGGKYFHELGYWNFHRSIALACEEENELPNKSILLTDVDHPGKRISYKNILTQSYKAKNNFTPARWSQFKKDVIYFKKELDNESWNMMMMDNGYCGTPGWTAIGLFGTNLFSIHNRWHRVVMISIDIILFFIMCLFILKTFDINVMFLSISFYCLDRNSSIIAAGSFFRNEWLTLFIIAICLIKQKRYILSGFLMGFISTTRLFPIVLSFGLGIKFLWQFLILKQINKFHLKYFLGFLMALLFLNIIIYIQFPQKMLIWKEFAKKTHSDRMLKNFQIGDSIGFKNLFLLHYQKPLENESKHNFIDKKTIFLENNKIFYYSIILFLLLLSIFRIKTISDDYILFPASIITIFLLSLINAYYYTVLLAITIYFASKTHYKSHAFGTAGLFLYISCWFLIIYLGPHIFRIYYIFNVMIFSILSYLYMVFHRSGKNRYVPKIPVP